MAEILLAGAPWGAAGRGAVAELMAGLGAEAELMAESVMEKRMPALWQRAIGKILLAGAPQWQRCWLAGAPWRSYCRGAAVAEILLARSA